MKRLLIIEDNKMMRTFLENYFKKDFRIDLHESPSKALRTFKNDLSEKFDLIISDFKPKGHPEFNALRSFLNTSKSSGIPCIMLTDEDKSSQRLASFTLSARDSISKPFNPGELNLRVKSITNQLISKPQLRSVA